MKTLPFIIALKIKISYNNFKKVKHVCNKIYKTLKKEIEEVFRAWEDSTPMFIDQKD